MMSRFVWKELGDLISFERGLTYSKGDEVEVSSVGVLRSNNVDLNTHRLNLDEIKYLREDFDVPDRKRVRRSSLLMCMSNGSKDHLGKVALIDRDLNYAFGGFMGLLTPEEELIYPRYLYYALTSKSFKDYIHSLSDGANINNLKFGDLAVFKVPVPPLVEQQKIVGILDAEFEKIDALKANAILNLQNSKDLFQSVLKSELEPKDGWKTVTVGDIADLKGGKRVPKGYKLETEPTGYPYIRVADFNEDGSVDMDDIHYISKEVYDGIKRYIITTEDVYISIAGTIGKSGIVPRELNGANLTENACRLVLKGNLNNKYIYYCTLSSQFKGQIAKLTMQAAQPKLALSRLATATMNIPPRSEQDRVVKVLTDLNDRSKALQANYEKTITLCDDLKQSLLRKVFSEEL